MVVYISTTSAEEAKLLTKLATEGQRNLPKANVSIKKSRLAETGLTIDC